jgi:hypothetical protein
VKKEFTTEDMESTALRKEENKKDNEETPGPRRGKRRRRGAAEKGTQDPPFAKNAKDGAPETAGD